MPGENTDVWMRMYEEQARHERHHEELRTRSTNMVIAISAAILAFSASTYVSESQQYLLGSLLVLINGYGLLMSLKHYERSHLHVTVASKYRDALSAYAKLSGLSINDVRQTAHRTHKNYFRVTTWLRAYVLWMGLHIVLAAIGVLVLAIG